MPRLLGVNIPENKRVEIALTYVFGIGRSLSKRILGALKIDYNKRAGELSFEEVNLLKKEIEKKYRVEGELRYEIATNIKRKKEIGCYQGIRHMKGLPVRGQQTRTNNRTRRGNVRRTTTSGKRSIEKT